MSTKKKPDYSKEEVFIPPYLVACPTRVSEFDVDIDRQMNLQTLEDAAKYVEGEMNKFVDKDKMFDNGKFGTYIIYKPVVVYRTTKPEVVKQEIN